MRKHLKTLFLNNDIEATGVFCSKRLPLNMKEKVYKTVVKPVMAYKS